MKIAIASDGGKVSQHFGFCKGFDIYELAGEGVSNKEFILNPGHKPGFLPVFLKDRGIDVIISGGMGNSAQQLFSENDIEIIVGAKGDCSSVAEDYAKGILKSTGEVCGSHSHEGECED